MTTYECNGYTIREREVEGQTRYEVLSKIDERDVLVWSTSFGDVANFCRSH